TYDDWQSGQDRSPYPSPPNHIVAIREQRFKLAKYYDASGTLPSQWEMYDLAKDPLEQTNLAYHGYRRTREQDLQYARLRRKLAQVDAVEHDDLEADAFDDTQRDVLRFTDEVVRDARASDDTFAAVAATLSPREIVELLMVIGQYMMLARVMATVDLELDEPAGRAVIDRASREG